MPPPMPGEQQEEKKGFFKKFFLKHEKENTDVPEPAHDDEIDLDEIKRKLGLDKTPEEAPEKTTPEPTTSFEPPVIEEEPVVEIPDLQPEAPSPVDIDSWTDESSDEVSEPAAEWSETKQEEDPTESSWDGSSEGGEHHDAVQRYRGSPHSQSRLQYLQQLADFFQAETGLSSAAAQPRRLIAVRVR